MSKPVHTGGAAPSLARAGTAWLALAGVTATLSLAAPGSAFRDRQLPGWAAVTLLATELVALAVLVAAGSAVLHLLRAAASGAGAPLLRWTLRAGGTGLRAAALFAYGASWACFWINGRFLGRDALHVFATNGAALCGYLAVTHPVLAGTVPALALGASFLAGNWLPRRLGARLSRHTPGVVRTAAAALALCAATSAAGEVARRAAPAAEALDRAYAFRRGHGAGPSLHALSDLIRPAAGPPAPRRAAPEEPRPRVAMREYAAALDRDRLDRLNVIVVVVDSLRADAIRAGGGADAPMPALERLAEEGRVYTDCVTQATHTDYAAPCVLSSHYPLRSRTIHRYPDSPPYPRVMVYDVLKAFGYRTALFSSQNEEWGRMDRYLRTGGLDAFFHAGASAVRPPGVHNPDQNLDDRVTVDQAIEWIGAGDPAPFFLALNLQTAHSPYVVPGAPPPYKVAFGAFPREKTPEVRAMYRQALAYVDLQLGRLFRHLRETGRWDRTVVAVTADHGEAFYEHGFAAHGDQLYDEIVKVPLVLRVPGDRPAVDGRPAQGIDLPPTLLGALGLPPHPSFQGIDLRAPDPDPDRCRYVVVQTPFARQYAVLRSGYKLIYDERRERAVLYDRRRDPGERRDLSGEEPERVADLLGRLGDWYRAQIDYYEDRDRHSRLYPPRR